MAKRSYHNFLMIYLTIVGRDILQQDMVGRGIDWYIVGCCWLQTIVS